MEALETGPIRFVVVQFVPDPIRQEALNVGVVGQHFDGRLVLRTVPKFGRIRRIVGGDSKALEDSLAFLRSALNRTPDFDLSILQTASDGILRFSEVRGGLATSSDDFLDEQFDLYCGENAIGRPRNVDVYRVRAAVRAALSKAGVDSDRYALERRGSVKGATTNHEFDFGFVNGSVSLLRAISLQTNERYLMKEVRDLSFAAVDVGKKDYKVTACVAMSDLGNETDAGEALRVLESNMAVVRYDSLDSTQLFRDLQLHQNDLKPLEAALLA